MSDSALAAALAAARITHAKKPTTYQRSTWESNGGAELDPVLASSADHHEAASAAALVGLVTVW